MVSLNLFRLATLALLWVCTGALAEFSTPHYLGHTRQHGEFRIYLGGGQFVGRTGSMQAIKVTAHQLRKGQPIRTLEGCVYRFDDKDRRRDRIDCSASMAGPLKGVEYARDLHPQRGHPQDQDLLVCVRGCSQQAPQRLSLEEADEDNG